MIQYSTSVINALMTLLASIGVLTVLHPALLPMIVMMTLPSAWATLVTARRRYLSFKVWTQHARAGRLISELLTSTHAAAEIRLHGIAAFLLHHFRSMSETAEEEQARLARLAARTGILASVLTGVAYAATFSMLGLLLWTGAMPLAVGGTAIIAIRTATSSLTSLVRQINYLNEESLFVGDLEHIQNEADRRAIPTTGRTVPEHVDGSASRRCPSPTRARTTGPLSTASTCTSPPEQRSRSSERTARARPPPQSSSPASTCPTRARSWSAAYPRARSTGMPGSPASPTSPRISTTGR